MFWYGALFMWVVCGFIALLCNTLNTSDDVKDIAVGGFWWLPVCFITRRLYKIYKEKKQKS